MTNIQIKNTSKLMQWVPGYKIFSPGEVREFTQEDAKILADNPFLVVVDKPRDAEIPSKSKSTNKTTQEPS
jgi:hypothetical protein